MSLPFEDRLDKRQQVALVAAGAVQHRSGGAPSGARLEAMNEREVGRITRPLPATATRLDVLAMRSRGTPAALALAERRHRLVDGKAGNIGGDLEQHPAGLGKVDRAGVAAILLLGRTLPWLATSSACHLGLHGIIGRHERRCDEPSRCPGVPEGSLWLRRCPRCRQLGCLPTAG